MQKYKFAEIVFHWKNESKSHISCVALKSQTELEIEDDSEEDRELFYYFNSYEELLEAFMSTNKNYDFVVDSIINLYEEF